VNLNSRPSDKSGSPSSAGERKYNSWRPEDGKIGYRAAIDRETLIVPLTQVCFSNGFRSEIRAIVQRARMSASCEDMAHWKLDSASRGN